MINSHNSISGLKTTKALNWSIPIVNHIWLEDCFIQWKNFSVGLGKYIDFPAGTDFAMILGERGPGRIVLGDLEREEELLAGDADRDKVGEGTVAVEVDGEKVVSPKRKEGTGTPKEKGSAKKKRKPGSAEQPVGTSTSAKEAREVEEVVGIFDGDGDAMMDVDENADDAGMTMDEDYVSPSKGSKTKKKARKSRDDDDDDEVIVVEEEELQREEKMERPKGRLIRRAGGRKEAEKEKQKEKTKDKETDRDGLGPSSKGKGKQKEIVLPDPDTESDDSHVEVRVKVKSTNKAKAKPPPPPIDDTDEEEADDDDDEPLVPKKAARTYSSKGKEKVVDNTSPVRTPKRVVSVVLPASRSHSSKKKPAPPTRTESLRVEADEASSNASPKRARPAKGSSGPVPESHSGGRRSLGGDNVTPASLPSKRSALIKATNHLHNVAMPDLMNYVQEKKKGFKGKESDRISDSRETSAGKGRKRPSDASADHPSSDEEEVDRKKKRKISAGGSRKKSALAASEEESGAETPTRKVVKKVRVVSYNEGSDESSGENVQKSKG
jgi:hypothetical protein